MLNDKIPNIIVTRKQAGVSRLESGFVKFISSTAWTPSNAQQQGTLKTL